jgi:putative acetyltransferase
MEQFGEFRIRPALNADSDVVKQLIFGVLNEFGLEADPSGTDADLENIETEYFSRGGTFEVIVDADGRILGTAGLYRLNETTVELRKMYFAPELRGRGYGKRLLERTIAKARLLGFSEIYLETASVLDAAGKLYRSFGFTPDPAFHSKRCDAAYRLLLTDESITA